MKALEASGVSKPQKALYLDIILYSKDQVQEETKALKEEDPNKDIDYDYSIISIKAQNQDHEIPMQPITMMRNALGKEEGGSGVPLERHKYLASVEFWQNFAMYKWLIGKLLIP